MFLAFTLTFLALTVPQDPPAADTPLAKRVVGHVVPIGAIPDEEGKVSDAAWERAMTNGDGLLLEAANDEVFLLHGLTEAQRNLAHARRGTPLEVRGTFAWQGRLRTLAVTSLQPASEEAHEKERATSPEYEMHGYVLVLIQPGPKQASFGAEERKKLSEGHFAHIAEQARAGKLVIAGPFGPQEPRRFSGLYIYRCSSVAEAEEINQRDPSIASGYFQTISLPWFGPRSLGY